MSQPDRTFRKDQLSARIYPDEKELGTAAAGFVADRLGAALEKRETANLILATGTSQFSFLEALKQLDIDWTRINVFHLDEYKGISDQHPASFRKYLKDRILNTVHPLNTYLIHGDSADLDREIGKYEDLLREHPIDVACIGIGENGHIAFNDPPVADFHDNRQVKVVKLDEACRMQQLGEGWFPALKDVPLEAVTLTIPAILSAGTISCVVPHQRKAYAVQQTINGPISTECPASILRNHPDTVLFLDRESASDV